MDYLTWNDSIGAKFFTPEAQDRRVYLYVTTSVIREIGKSSGAGMPEFLAAIRKGPPWVLHGNVCERAFHCFSSWRRRNLKYPPYLAYLGLFALAAGHGDFAINAYYPRLRRLLGETPRAGRYPAFSSMRKLWEDLENWTLRDKHGALGIFQARITSRFIHVGIPISQTILSEQERLALPSIFATAAIDPASAPSEAVLVDALIKHGGSRLRPRTRTILEQRSQSEDEFEALIDAVLQELAEWDGTVISLGEETARKSIFGTARLWCEVDSISERMQLRLLCRSRHEFPEDGLLLKFVGDTEQYRCDEFRDGWSTPLRSEYGDFDAAQIDWCSGIRLREVDRNWRFSLNSSPVRLLVSGASEGLSGYVEAQRLAPNMPFLLLVRHDCDEVIEEWGRGGGCSGLRRMDVQSGLPSGWSAFSADYAIDDDLVRDTFPVLSFPMTVQISFQGGISASASTYFSFALPEVSVIGASPSAELFCNGESLGMRSPSALQLSGKFADDAKLTFEVRAGKQTISRRAIYVWSGISWPDVKPVCWCDSNGRLCNESTKPRAAGSLTVASDISSFDDLLREEPLPDDVLICPADRSSTGAFKPLEPESPTVVTPQPQPAAVLPEAELRNLIAGWKSDITQGIEESRSVGMKSRPRGAELTEGYLQYLAGSQIVGRRNWFRCIRELSDAAKSPDEIIRTVAAALLQLVFHKLGRSENVRELADRQFPIHFERLRSFMTLLAGQELSEICMTGIGIGDISPIKADTELEESLFSHRATEEHQWTSESPN
jgi:hypothetical protein